MSLVKNVHEHPSIHCANDMYHNCTLRRSSLLNGTCSITFSFTTFAWVFFTEYTKVYVRRLYFVRRPETQYNKKLSKNSFNITIICFKFFHYNGSILPVLPRSIFMGWQVIRIAWLAPKLTVNSSLGDVSGNWDYKDRGNQVTEIIRIEAIR